VAGFLIHCFLHLLSQSLLLPFCLECI
jgi:hypothetical protein